MSDQYDGPAMAKRIFQLERELEAANAELGKFSERNVYALRDRIKALEEQVANLKGHAEAMADYFGESESGGDGPDFINEPVVAYRLAHPEHG